VTPAVAIVMPTYARGRIAAASLEAIGRVDVPESGIEIVVVDDGSPAEHAAIVERAVGELPFARLLRQGNRGPAAARNLGVASTSAPLVAFLDDDCAPAPDWLRELVAPFDNGDASLAGVGGRVLPAPPTNWVGRFCAATEYSSGVQPVFENAATANACYRRAVLDELSGFDEGFRHPGGDDPDLSERARAAGYRLEFAPAAIVYHHELDDYRDFVGHMYRRGLGEARLAEKHGRRARVIARALLFPAYLGRTGLGCWRRTARKGRGVERVAWTALELVGRAAFLAGSVRGLASG
jgi:GT2 family glycosyltransferase